MSENNINDVAGAVAPTLATIEHNAKCGRSLPPEETLLLLSILRNYMAIAVETNQKVDAMLKQLGGAL